MISNSVIHLRSYTNNKISDITGNSTLSANVSASTNVCSERQCLNSERWYCCIEWPPCDGRHRHTKRRHLRIERRYRRIEWRVFGCFMMFHNVLRVFHDVLLVVHDALLVVHDVLRCITMFYMCFMIFNNVLWCLASHATIGISDRTAADRFRDQQ